jgi:dTDP-4-amino-4,6-dideoxygalactose transaminase
MLRREIRLTRPALRREDLGPLVAIVDSGWLTNGPRVAEFEDGLRQLLGVGHVIACSSGTAALQMAVLACGVGPGDEVIVPDFTFPATANAVEHSGAKAVLVDIDPGTYNLDLGLAEQAITAKTRAILPVHQFGRPMDLGALGDLARRHGLSLIEDAACALGATWGAKRCGTAGIAGCFSFHPRKIITTGEGGAVATDDDGVASRCRQLRNHGALPGPAADYALCGFNFRISDVNAALGLAQLPRLDLLIEARRRLAAIYDERLRDVPGVRLPAPAGAGRHVYQSYVIVLAEGLDRDGCVRALGERGIESGPGARALHTLRYYRERYGYAAGDLKRSFRVAGSTLALPLHPEMSEDDVRFVVAALTEVLAS